jgi:dihydroorotate dehydrogenase
MYRLLRPALFRLGPERAHALVMAAAVFAARHPGALRLLELALAQPDPRLAVPAFGLRFPNPIGLAAGFDKDGVAAAAWPAFGFGYTELGTVTALAQPGNPPPRVFRYPEAEAVINRMGFNNAGAEALARQVAAARRAPWWGDAPVGVNVGKSRAVPLDDAVDDYRRALESVWSVADYLVLNVSSPNTPGLRELQEGERLEALLALTVSLRERLGDKPLLLKLSPDLDDDRLDGIALSTERYGVSGIVAVNTTVARSGLRHDPGEPGGLSGRPLAERALEVLRALRARTRLPLVAVGGIDSADAVIERLRAGATLVQLYTGWIFRGPGLPRRIARGLLAFLEREEAPDLQTWLSRRDAA